MEESDSDSCETEPLVVQKSENKGGARRKTTTRTKDSQHHESQSSSSKKTSRNKSTNKQQEKTSPAINNTTTSKPDHLNPLPEERQHKKVENHTKIFENGQEILHEENDEENGSLLCPIFGVRNYLNHFYEKTEVQNESIYEDMPSLTDGREAIFLVKRQDGLCSSSVFRLSLMLGGIILAMGIIALTTAACATRRATLVGEVAGVAVVDQLAASHNAEVDALVLVGLVALTLGATVLSSALISRAFCHRPEDDVIRDGSLPGYTSIYDYPPFLRPVDRKVPVTEEVSQVQPWISATHPHMKANLH